MHTCAQLCNFVCWYTELNMAVISLLVNVVVCLSWLAEVLPVVEFVVETDIRYSLYEHSMDCSGNCKYSFIDKGRVLFLLLDLRINNSANGYGYCAYLVQLLQLLQTDSLACIRATPELWAALTYAPLLHMSQVKPSVYPFMTLKELIQYKSEVKWHDTAMHMLYFSCVQRWRSRNVDWDRAIFSASQCGSPLRGRSRCTSHTVTCMLTTGQHLLLVYMPKSMGLLLSSL